MHTDWTWPSVDKYQFCRVPEEIDESRRLCETVSVSVCGMTRMMLFFLHPERQNERERERREKVRIYFLLRLLY